MPGEIYPVLASLLVLASCDSTDGRTRETLQAQINLVPAFSELLAPGMDAAKTGRRHKLVRA